MRQRHSQGSIWSEDDLEGGTINMIPPRAWTEIIEKALWVFSVVFIVYYGDKDHNFIHLLWGDDRIRRTPLHLGMVAFLFDAVFLFYTNLLALVKTNSDAMWEILTPSCAPFVILFGVFSFCSFSIALWPIWGFLTLPLLFFAVVRAVVHIVDGLHSCSNLMFFIVTIILNSGFTNCNFRKECPRIHGPREHGDIRFFSHFFGCQLFYN